MRPRPAAVAIALPLAVAWAVAAYLLWRTSVPGSLRLPHLDPHAYFTAAQLRAAASFARFGDAMWWASTLVELGALALFARYGARWAGESAAGPLGTGMLLGMLGFALVWAVDLPFGVAELWWERRHGISRVGYVTYLFGDWLSLGGEFVFLCLALAIVMGLARLLGRHWWLAATPVFVGLVALFAFVSPYLLTTHRLDDPVLAADAARLEAREHVGRVPVVVQDVHDVTSLPNAEAMGIGPSRRVVVWDTLVDGRFGIRELRVVVAHEVGHLAHDDIWRQVGWFALFALPGTFLIGRATRRRGGMGEPAAIPLSLLVLVALQLLALPAQNEISRHIEAAADWAALDATRDPAAAATLFRRFVPETLDEPSPSTLDYVLFENHPTIMQRLAMVRAWRRVHR
jgi:STE24 endopeptidase